MKKYAFLLVIGLYSLLAGILYAATTEPKTTLAPEDTKVASADFPNQNAFICLYRHGGEIALNGRTYTLQGETTVDQFGGATSILDTLTKNAATILPDGSADIYIDGEYRTFSPE